MTTLIVILVIVILGWQLNSAMNEVERVKKNAQYWFDRSSEVNDTLIAVIKERDELVNKVHDLEQKEAAAAEQRKLSSFSSK